MTDRELLELAAKALGRPLVWQTDRISGREYCRFASCSGEWSPLNDDGDALRLAVALRIDIGFWDGFKHVVCYRRQDRNKGRIAAHGTVGYGEGAGALPTHENVRRAIVRAAAEIGRTRP